MPKKFVFVKGGIPLKRGSTVCNSLSPAKLGQYLLQSDSLSQPGRAKRKRTRKKKMRRPKGTPALKNEGTLYLSIFHSRKDEFRYKEVNIYNDKSIAKKQR